MVPHLIRGPDAAGTSAEEVESDVVAHGNVVIPDVRATRLVLAEGVMVTERELEEAEAVQAATDRFVVVLVE